MLDPAEKRIVEEIRKKMIVLHNPTIEEECIGSRGPDDPVKVRKIGWTIDKHLSHITIREYDTELTLVFDDGTYIIFETSQYEGAGINAVDSPPIYTAECAFEAGLLDKETYMPFFENDIEVGKKKKEESLRRQYENLKKHFEGQ